MLRSRFPGPRFSTTPTETRPGCSSTTKRCAGHGYHILVAGIELRRRGRGAVGREARGLIALTR
jgi:hypothetical protein